MSLRVRLALMIFGCWCCFAVSAAPLISENAIDTGGPEDQVANVDETIKRVEDILKANPNLPRLSKDDILVLLNNITTEDKLGSDVEKEVVLDTTEKVLPKKDGKAIMVVLPYKPEDGDMEELFTRPPIVKMLTTETLPKFTKEYEGKYQNHKNFPKTKTDTLKSGTITEEAPNAQFWHSQSQKVMNDLNKKNQKNSSTPKPKLEKEDYSVQEKPFKIMPGILSGSAAESVSNVEIPEVVIVEKDAVNDSQQSESGVIVPSDLENVKKEPTHIEGLEHLINSMTNYKDSPERIHPVYESKLPPTDVQEMIESYGLSELNPINDQLSLETSPYAMFKPLPTGQVSPSEMDPKDLSELLAEFGILDSDVRDVNLSAEDVKTEAPVIVNMQQPAFIDADMFPAEMASTLTDLGLSTKKGRKLSTEVKYDEDTKDIDTESSQHSIALSPGPDPLSIEELGTVDDQIQNDIAKRQQSVNITSEITEVTTATPKAETTTTEEAKDGPNIADLESSFGGSPADDDPSEAELPPPRKNGFYYMLDWNSFLEVGDGDTKVNIRFDPKLGDPQRFISVTVP